MRVKVAAFLLAASLAGCLGSDGEEVVPAAQHLEQAGAVVSSDGTVLAPATFPDALLVDETIWANGTFRIEQQGRPVGVLPGISVTERTGLARFDITDKVPRGIPVVIIAEVDAKVQNGDVDLWPEFPDDEWRTGWFDTPYGGKSRFEVGLVHTSSEPVAVMLAYDEMDQQAEFPYTVSIRVVADPALLVNGFATGATLPADAQLAVELVGEKREREMFEGASLMVFAPDDTYLGSFPLDDAGLTSIQLPPESPAGEYAMLLSQGGRAARLLVGGNATLRPLTIEWIEGAVQTGDAAGHVEWTSTYDRAPLLAGVFFTSPNVASAVEVSLAGPAGPIFGGRADGGPWWSVRLPEDHGTGSTWGWDSGWGAPGLLAGAYTGKVDFEQGAGAQPIEALDFAAFYVR